MSKAVLISIHPGWCELIVTGAKTIEVRKTRPKMKTPFKCYIYCTKPKRRPDDFGFFVSEQKIIGEFTCDEIYSIWAGYTANLGDDCLTFNERESYLGTGMGYGWHISKVKLYTKPKELSAFPQVRRPPLSWCYVEEG